MPLSMAAASAVAMAAAKISSAVRTTTPKMVQERLRAAGIGRILLQRRDRSGRRKEFSARIYRIAGVVCKEIAIAEFLGLNFTGKLFSQIPRPAARTPSTINPGIVASITQTKKCW